MKIGIIGAGAIARRAHLPTWKKISPKLVKSIADIDITLARRVAIEFDISNFTNDYKQILDDSEIDLVDIATPTPSHFEVIVEAIKRKKHIIVEKPLVMTTKEAIRIKKILEGTNLKLTVIQNYRYYPCAIEAKQRVEAGKIGKVLSIEGTASSRFPSSWTRSEWLYHKGGVLYDFTPHLVDLIVWIVKGYPKKVCAFGGNFTRENMDFTTYAEIIIEFDNGCVCSISTSWLTGTNMLKLNLHGTGGHIFLDIKENIFQEVHGTITPLDNLKRFRREISSLVKGILNKSFFIGPVFFYLPLFKDFLDCIESNSLPNVTIDDAIKSISILESAQQSIENNEIIDINEIISDK